MHRQNVTVSVQHENYADASQWFPHVLAMDAAGEQQGGADVRLREIQVHHQHLLALLSPLFRPGFLDLEPWHLRACWPGRVRLRDEPEP